MRIPLSQDDIERLQTNLQTIRQAGGWSTSAFGDLLGVSKQTVCNLENGISKMNKLQYIGIRVILDYEIKQHPENEVLAYAVRVLLDSDRLTEEEKTKAKNAVAYASGAKKVGLDAATISAGLAAILGVISLSTYLAGFETINWLTALMKKKGE